MSNTTPNLTQSLTLQPSDSSNSLSDGSLSKTFNQLSLLQAVVEGFIDGVMIVTDRGEVLQANRYARQICRHCNPHWVGGSNSGNGKTSQPDPLPAEVWQVCQALIENCNLFPGQPVIAESKIILQHSIQLRVRAQWLRLADEMSRSVLNDRPCILIMLEDQIQTLQSRVLTDIQKYRLTPAEGRVWQLRLQGYSYREITNQLHITENTVKKHIKSIMTKRRSVFTAAKERYSELC